MKGHKNTSHVRFLSIRIAEPTDPLLDRMTEHDVNVWFVLGAGVKETANLSLVIKLTWRFQDAVVVFLKMQPLN